MELASDGLIIALLSGVILLAGFVPMDESSLGEMLT